MSDLLDGLNNMQKEAVQYTENPCLVIAGAGSGKTKVLTHKIAYLMEELNVKPWNILAITFTNKAAQEMKTRANALVGPQVSDLWIGTFHSICVRILRKFIDRVGYNSNFIIFDTVDQKSLMKRVLAEMNIDNKTYPEKMFLSAISNAKNEMLTPEDYALSHDSDMKESMIGKVYAFYQKSLKAENAVDFDDIINLTIKILQENDEILAYYSEKFEYILVDEYQDTNKAQFTLIKLLASYHKKITVVGDNDQGIYSFRGADITNILNFEKDFPNAKVIKLEQNYRCTKSILNIANEVIKNNENKFEKNLWTENDEGEKPLLHCALDHYKEGEFIVEKINELRREEYFKYSDFAVLYRMNAQSRAIEDVLVREGIPYKIIGGLKFYERKEIKDTLAYLRLIANPYDNLSLIRVINEPKRGIGKVALQNIEDMAAKTGLSMYEVVRESSDLMPKITNNVRDFVMAIESFRNLEMPVTDIIQGVLEKSGYMADLKAQKTQEAIARIENIDELLTVAGEFDNESADKSLTEFLNSLSLASDTDDLDTDENPEDTVTLMTLHSAKGLEYPAVFLVGVEQGIFPSFQSLTEKNGIEEERRLFYVGITRAERYLFISTAKQRTIYNSTSFNPPSMFIKEIPGELVENYEGALSKYKSRKIESDNAISSAINNNSGFRKINTKEIPNTINAFLKEQEKETKYRLENYKVGMRIKHKKFGEGVITNLEKEDDDYKVDLEFEKAGHKRLMLKFAKLEILD